MSVFVFGQVYLPARNEMGWFNAPRTEHRSPGWVLSLMQVVESLFRYTADGPRTQAAKQSALHRASRRQTPGRLCSAALRRGWCQMIQIIKVRLNSNAREPYNEFLRTGGRVGE